MYSKNKFEKLKKNVCSKNKFEKLVRLVGFYYKNI